MKNSVDLCSICGRSVIVKKATIRVQYMTVIPVDNSDKNEIYQRVTDFLQTVPFSEEEKLELLDITETTEYGFIHAFCKARLSMKELEVTDLSIKMNDYSQFAPYDKKYVDIDLIFNGKLPQEFMQCQATPVFSFALNPVEYHRSCTSSGRYYIFTCDCGDAGCGGWFKGIQVVHENTKIRWIVDDFGNNMNPDNNMLTKPVVLTFSRAQYIDIDAKIIESLTNAQNAGYQYGPPYNQTSISHILDNLQISNKKVYTKVHVFLSDGGLFISMINDEKVAIIAHK